MSNERPDTDAPEGSLPDEGAAQVGGTDVGDSNAGDGDAPRMRFQGIVEADSGAAVGQDDNFGMTVINRNERRWNPMSRQVWQASRLTAIFVFFSFIVGLPLGNWIAHLQLYGGSDGWNPFAAYEMGTLLFAIVVPAIILMMGYAFSKMATMLNAAESIAEAAQQFVTPDVTALRNADTVGDVMRGHMTTLNQGLDGALTRLANVESMIRQHVEAIEIAGDAIELKATGAVERVADERSRLMELTESLNAHADSFAAAIAERANASIEAIQSADTISERVESEFDDRLVRLEDAAARALSSFESLRDALRDTDETMRTSAQSIDTAAEQTLKATERATVASNAAAESAALNAANVGASANRAALEARKASEEAIQTAADEAERIAQSALDAAAAQSSKVQEATKKTLGEMSATTREAIDAAKADAEEATKTAAKATEAARKTGEAARAASADVAAASAEAQKESQAALKFTETAATKIEERNKALAEARTALERENKRLETLIEEQSNRADRLANAITSQTERLSKLAEAQLREQEASAKLAAAQAEREAQMKREAEREAQAAKQAEEEKKAEAAAAQKAAKEKQAAAKRKQKDDASLNLTPKEQPAPNRNGAARLEELARDIAERRPTRDKRARREPIISTGQDNKPKPETKKKMKGDVSWREILDAADDAEPLELGAVSKNANGEEHDDAVDAIRIISSLQDFTYELETRLYGNPPPALQERYDRGDRNVFANRLLRLNETDVKRRIRSESARDRKFEGGVHTFLQGFEKLLEDATTSETADEELEEYLSSPLGRVYLLIGATVGYFA
ncbi:MAG: hypothetical protein DHS20C05_08520 [Hyphococcus sp.]|nr:MAG: hypothetical protein DHS20C05_08520 [Marinicaulis sp.]